MAKPDADKGVPVTLWVPALIVFVLITLYVFAG